MADQKVLPFPREREFTAAKLTMLRSEWPTWSRPPDADIRYGLRTLRARARHEAQNSDHARAFLREVKTNVVGPDGVVMQSKVRLRNGKPDKRARDAVEDSWRMWGEVGHCEVTGQLSWCDEQCRMIETVARDGEAIYRIVPDWENRWSFAIQAIDPETIDLEYNEDLGNGRYVVMGVEFDTWRRPIAYHLIEEAPASRVYQSYRGRKRMRVPADQILHCYLPEWVWQSRGVPWMATALKRMHDTSGYEESAVVAARAGASKMGFFEQGEEGATLLRDDGTTEPGAAVSGDSGGQLYENFEPGGIGVLPPGYKFSGWNPTYPHAEHGNFIKATLRGVASGLGVSYAALSNDYEGANYSSLRQAALTERDVWRMVQRWMIGTFHTRVYRAWLSSSLLVGAVAANGRPYDLGREQDFRRVSWQARRWQWVDPAKEATAAEKEIALNVRSVSDVIRERGKDPEDVWQEIADERARMEELGITPEEAVAAVMPETDDDDQEEQEDDAT